MPYSSCTVPLQRASCTFALHQSRQVTHPNPRSYDPSAPRLGTAMPISALHKPWASFVLTISTPHGISLAAMCLSRAARLLHRRDRPFSVYRPSLSVIVIPKQVCGLQSCGSFLARRGRVGMVRWARGIPSAKTVAYRAALINCGNKSANPELRFDKRYLYCPKPVTPC